MELFIPDYLNTVIKTIENNNGEAYLVGGCVRDTLLNISPDDYDVTTSLLPEKITTIFEKTIATGLKHGTVTVISENKPIEVTTYRADGSYIDSRHPKKVSYVSNLNEDLSRRDFTINAMAYNHTSGLVDLFGGKEDLNKKIIRTVGNPNDRFSEDALRILRLFRFCAQLDFDAEAETLEAALRLSHKLQNISRERIATELIKALLSSAPQKLNPLLISDALSFCGIPACSINKEFTFLPKEKYIRFAAFIASSDGDAEEICKNLKVENALLKYCIELSQLLKKEITDKISCKKALRDFSLKAVRDSIIIKGQSTETLELVIDSKEPYKISHLAVNGNDLAELKIQGKEIGSTLSHLTDFVIKNPQYNTKEKLLNIVRNNI
ncbi:MAG: polynucleotide adenylyltransferase [Acutalibacteraceae bacterium]|nr:polynucleotide adenylyltransferase [Acutalibacteraceae bacterium]